VKCEIGRLKCPAVRAKPVNKLHSHIALILTSTLALAHRSW